MSTTSDGYGPLFEGKRILITGGTGSLGHALTRRLLSLRHGRPERIVIFSRDEAKQYHMRLWYQKLQAATEEFIYEDFRKILQFRIGDIRDAESVYSAVRGNDVIFSTAALKQVPSCEYFPHEAAMTNIIGASNIVRAIEKTGTSVETVIGISTDKACKPVNVMGMTKAIQERVFTSANLRAPQTRFMCVRYGNVLASRGSVIPLFHSQIRAGGPVTITSREMTRFMLSLEQAVDAIIAAYAQGTRGELFVPKVPSSRIVNIARCLIGERSIKLQYVGIRPGEKVHEILVSEDEIHRTVTRGQYYVVRPILPELCDQNAEKPALDCEYSSQRDVMSLDETRQLLEENRMMIDDNPVFDQWVA